MVTTEAFLLLTLPDVELTAPGTRQRGTLELDCVTVPSAPADRDVFLLLRLNAYETVVDPDRQISLHAHPATGVRTYTLHRTPSDPAELTLVLAGKALGPDHAADVDTLDSVLSQYAHFVHAHPRAEHSPTPPPSGPPYGAAVSSSSAAAASPNATGGEEDFRGKLILVDQDNGEVLGAVDQQVRADPQLLEKGHERDAVVINVGPSGELEAARDIFARAIPAHEHNLMTRGASMLSTGITTATNLVVNGINAASNMYIQRAVPHPSASPPAPGAPRVPPPRAVTWLTSDSTQRGMHTAHAYTGKAVQVSGKTVSMVESLIGRAVGGAPSLRPKKRQALADIPDNERSGTLPHSLQPGSSMPFKEYAPNGAGGGGVRRSPSPLSPDHHRNAHRSPYGDPFADKPARPTVVTGDEQYPSSQFYNVSPSASSTSLVLPPPYTNNGAPADRGLTPPPLPSRGGKDRSPSPNSRGYVPPRVQRIANDANGGPPAKMGLKDKAALSTHLLLSTIDDSVYRLVNVGSDRLTAVVGHKYGPDAARSTRMLTGTARNVGLVYVDVTGFGRRALLQTAGKQWIKARVRGREVQLRTDSRGEVVQAQDVERK